VGRQVVKSGEPEDELRELQGLIDGKGKPSPRRGEGSFAEVKMKAAVLEKPGQLLPRKLPDPTCPPGGVLVQVMASLVCSTDYQMWKVGHPPLRCPRILGREIAGVVAQVSSEVRGINEGDRFRSIPGVPVESASSAAEAEKTFAPTLRYMASAWMEALPSMLPCRNRPLRAAV